MTDAEIRQRLTNLAGRSATQTEGHEAMTEQTDAQSKADSPPVVSRDEG